MSINALIAQGGQPIGGDVPQIVNMLQQRAQQTLQNNRLATQDQYAADEHVHQLDQFNQQKEENHAKKANDLSYALLQIKDPHEFLARVQQEPEIMAGLQQHNVDPSNYDQVLQGVKSTYDLTSRHLNIAPPKPMVVGAGDKVYAGQDPLNPNAPPQLLMSNEKSDAITPYQQEQLKLERRGQDMTAARARAGDRAPAYRDIIDPKNPKQLITIDGNLYKGGSVGDPGVIGIAGKEPTAAKEAETRGTGRSAVSDQIAGLRDLYTQLQQGGGITDTSAGSVTNAARAVKESGIGQATGRFFGTKNQSVRNGIQQSRPLLLQAIRSATGMSSKQMDSNVELKLYLSAATDPQLDVQTNMRALDHLEALFGGSSDAPAAPGPRVGAGASGSWGSSLPPDIAALVKKHGG